MIRTAKAGTNRRVVQEFGQALRDRAFRIALVLSLLAHLALLLFFGWGRLSRQDEKRIPLMRVRLLAPAAPPAHPAAPASSAPARPPRSEPPARPGAALPPPPVAATSAPTVQPGPAGPGTASAPDAALPPLLATRSAAGDAAAPPEPAVAPDPGAPAADAATLSAVAPAARAEPVPVSAGDGVAAADTVAGRAPDAGRLGEEAPASPGDPSRTLDAGVHAPGAASGSQRPGAPDLALVSRRIEARKVYPRIAVRNGWEGKVLVEMHLEGDGRLSAVRLLQRSGHDVLDEATIDAVRRAAPFPPIARVLTVPVEYRLVP